MVVHTSHLHVFTTLGLGLECKLKYHNLLYIPVETHLSTIPMLSLQHLYQDTHKHTFIELMIPGAQESKQLITNSSTSCDRPLGCITNGREGERKSCGQKGHLCERGSKKVGKYQAPL